MPRFRIAPFLCAVAVSLLPAGLSAKPPLPWEAPALHLGVATCAGSTCHGANRALDETAVLQNEYTTWERDDAHSNAYKVLLTPEARRMAANLGYAKPAHESPACLTCHSDWVPEAQRGRRHKLSDGVGCEACHGGAENWIGPHVSDSSHADNLAAGLYPLPQPVARARLCLDCHMGSTRKPIDHRMMGAGHPPLGFELDTFTNIQPAHFRVDADYRERKGEVSGLRLWMLGQLIATEQFLDGLMSERFVSHGLFPELVFFDCNACHHPMTAPRWMPGLAGQAGPGQVRLFNASLAMSEVIVARLFPDEAQGWTADVAALHDAATVSVPAIKAQATKLSDRLDRLLPRAEAAPADTALAKRLMQTLTEQGQRRDAGDYSSAQQIAMALEALGAYAGAQQPALTTALKPALDAVFKTVASPVAYDAEGFKAALQQTQQALR